MALVVLFTGTVLYVAIRDAGIETPMDAWRYRECRQDPAGLPPIRTPSGDQANYLHTCYDRLYDSTGRRVQITGINWFGMETGTYAPHGLWTRNWQAMLDQIADLGYNTIRLPFSNETLHATEPSGSINYDLNPDLSGLRGIEVMDKIIEGAGQRGLRVILDRHRPTVEAQSDLWYTEEVSEEQWIADWVMLARRYKGNDTVIAVDLHNEPRGPAAWGTGDVATDWRLAAERAGNAVLEANPYLLVFVEGIERVGDDWYWWGGNLTRVAEHPVRLSVPNRVVYSPHEYGPGVYRQGWFDDPAYPRNLPALWDRQWGYIAKQRIAPVVVGEFGGVSTGDDDEGVWQRILVEYMRKHDIGYLAWSFNPNSHDTGGLLEDDWYSVDTERHNLYRTYLAPPMATATSRERNTERQVQARVTYQARDTSQVTNNIAFVLRVYNDGAVPLDLSRVELRYWFTADGPYDAHPVVRIGWAAVGTEYVRAEIARELRGDQDHFARITFSSAAGSVQPYASSGDILVRIHKSDWADYLQTNDFSFDPANEPRESSRIPLYLDGKRAQGYEP